MTGVSAQVWAVPADDAPGRWRLILGAHRHGRYIERVLRGGLGDVEALLVRVLVAALKELARGMLPRPLRRHSTPVRDLVCEQ